MPLCRLVTAPPLCIAGGGAAHGAARPEPSGTCSAGPSAADAGRGGADAVALPVNPPRAGSWNHTASRRRRRRQAAAGGGAAKLISGRCAAARGHSHKLLWPMQCAIDVPGQPTGSLNGCIFAPCCAPWLKHSTQHLCSISPSHKASNPRKAYLDCKEPRRPTHLLQEAVARAATRLS